MTIYKAEYKNKIIITLAVVTLAMLLVSKNQNAFIIISSAFLISTLFFLSSKKIVTTIVINANNNTLKIETSRLFLFFKTFQEFDINNVDVEYRKKRIGRGTPTKVLCIRVNGEHTFEIIPTFHGWSYTTLDEIITEIKKLRNA